MRLLVDEHAAGEDERLGTLAGGDEALIDEQLIETEPGGAGMDLGEGSDAGFMRLLLRYTASRGNDTERHVEARVWRGSGVHALVVRRGMSPRRVIATQFLRRLGVERRRVQLRRPI